MQPLTGLATWLEVFCSINIDSVVVEIDVTRGARIYKHATPDGVGNVVGSLLFYLQ